MLESLASRVIYHGHDILSKIRTVSNTKRMFLSLHYHGLIGIGLQIANVSAVGALKMRIRLDHERSDAVVVPGMRTGSNEQWLARSHRHKTDSTLGVGGIAVSHASKSLHRFDVVLLNLSFPALVRLHSDLDALEDFLRSSSEVHAKLKHVSVLENVGLGGLAGLRQTSTVEECT